MENESRKEFIKSKYYSYKINNFNEFRKKLLRDKVYRRKMGGYSMYKLKKSPGTNFQWYANCLIILITAISFTSCKPAKELHYFKTLQKDTVLQSYVSPGLETKIRKGDNLGISINSLSQEENVKFNSTIISNSSGGVSTPTYLVSPEGTIKMHRLGEIKVEGMTRKELAQKLQNDLQPYLKMPLVNVTYMNRKITVMGGVSKPSVINMQDEQMTLIDALVSSGDIIHESKKDNILIIRTVDSSKIVKRVNLQDASIFNSEWFYLQADDIVYVSPDYEKVEKEERRRRLQTTVSMVATITSLFIVILTRVF